MTFPQRRIRYAQRRCVVLNVEIRITITPHCRMRPPLHWHSAHTPDKKSCSHKELCIFLAKLGLLAIFGEMWSFGGLIPFFSPQEGALHNKSVLGLISWSFVI
jgi:hypothetical protein